MITCALMVLSRRFHCVHRVSRARTACALRVHDARERVLFCIYHSIDTISFGWFIVMQTSIGERNAFESALIALAPPYNRCTNPLSKLTLLVIAVDAR